MIDCFKASIVVNGRPPILGFDCFDFQVSTVPMPEFKLLLDMCASENMELYRMDTFTAFISASLKPDEIIYCNPSRGILWHKVHLNILAQSEEQCPH